MSVQAQISRGPETAYRLTAALFVRLLGLIYLIAFASLAVQIEGLAGSDGILPIAEKLAYLRTQPGYAHYLGLPTLLWFSASDASLNSIAALGCLAAVLIIINWFSYAARIAAFVLYLSLYHACQPFLNFQWDGLLLEAGFLAIFLTPNSRVVILLFRWLLFRLRFMSGLSKLTLGDPAWSGLTALNSYFEIQPLPTPLAWYAHQLPEWLLKVGTAGTLFVELLVPFMMFLPRRWRFTAAWLTILWQVLIILTSNHNWINFLTIILCLFLFDDRALRRVLPVFLLTALNDSASPPARPGLFRRTVSSLGITGLASLILVAGSIHLWELATLQRSSGLPGKLLDHAEALRIVSKYHVFPTMQTERVVLEIQGSLDGQEWRPYAFSYMPGALDQRPKVVLPHQPRLDWQMWFVTLHPRDMPWFSRFLYKLLDNSPTVTGLLAYNPFPQQAPRYIRVDAWRYRFTTPDQRRETGHWWQREALGPFGPLPWLSRQAGAGDRSGVRGQ